VLRTKSEAKLTRWDFSHWQEICDFEGQARELQDEIRSLNLKAEDTTRLLEKLRKTNIYNDAFRIGHDGSFGTINGLRFGRLPNQPVEWSEINAAAGQALFLLDVLAKKLNFIFKGYKLCPMGSFSKIEKTTEGEKVTLEL
jgi:beclin 1